MNPTAHLGQHRVGEPRPRERKRAALPSLEVITAILGLLGLVFILAVAGLASWNEYRTARREAQEHAKALAFSLADHANRLFEVSDVALRSASLAIGQEDWPAIEASRSVWTSLHETAAFLPYVDDIWLNDAAGLLRLTTFAFPAPFSDATGRTIFQQVKADGPDLVIGERFVGRITNKPTFLVARRMTNPDGSFRGMASVTLDLSYFPTYWRGLDLPNDERISFLRGQQGDVLISYQKSPQGDRKPIDANTFLAAVAHNPDQGAFESASDGYGFYHRVGVMPVYVTVEFARSSIMRSWTAWMMRLLPLVVLVTILLVAIVAVGLRQARRQAQAARDLEDARNALAQANRTLEHRVAERTADLQESNDEIQRFAYIVSHDLRAPLVNIMGFTAELQALRPALFPDLPSGAATHHFDAPEPVRRDFDEAIGFIRSSIEKMDRLIKAILALSRQGQRRFQPEIIDLSNLMRSIADGVAHRAQKAGATIKIGALPVVQSDRIALEQIFTNLIDNAVKYLRPGAPGLVEISGEQRGNGVVVTVEDNGRGIDAKDVDRVFELFRRAGPQDQPGEGIGLAYVRGLVRRLGGKISLKTTRGQGCLFTVELPELADEEETKASR